MPDDWSEVIEEFDTPLAITLITNATTATLMVPTAGHRLEIFRIMISAADGVTPAGVEFKDG
jgi:hypothetical protein